ncbi:hypothetical protein LSAT2_005608 [Lamellibrachia satsuma]|nr:hypothetical protein LSAT2_005608 [Lamellibrachia satsuma]
MERLINTRLTCYPEKQQVFTPQQAAGFRRNKSTEDQVNFIAQEIEDALLDTKHTLTIWIDPEEAFDRGWRDGMKLKMHQCGISGLMNRRICQYPIKRKARNATGKTVLQWIPAHFNIPGNGEVEKLAKEEGKLDQEEKEAGIHDSLVSRAHLVALSKIYTAVKAIIARAVTERKAPRIDTVIIYVCTNFVGSSDMSSSATCHRQPHVIVSHMASSATWHCQPHVIVIHMASSATCHRQPHGIVSHMASSATCHRQPHGIVSHMASSATCHRQPHGIVSHPVFVRSMINKFVPI